MVCIYEYIKNKKINKTSGRWTCGCETMGRVNRTPQKLVVVVNLSLLLWYEFCLLYFFFIQECDFLCERRELIYCPRTIKLIENARDVEKRIGATIIYFDTNKFILFIFRAIISVANYIYYYYYNLIINLNMLLLLWICFVRLLVSTHYVYINWLHIVNFLMFIMMIEALCHLTK